MLHTLQSVNLPSMNITVWPPSHTTLWFTLPPAASVGIFDETLEYGVSV